MHDESKAEVQSEEEEEEELNEESEQSIKTGKYSNAENRIIWDVIHSYCDERSITQDEIRPEIREPSSKTRNHRLLYKRLRQSLPERSQHVCTACCVFSASSCIAFARPCDIPIMDAVHL
jgi:DNA-directed RNA polymerase specialized sigma subunit